MIIKEWDKTTYLIGAKISFRETFTSQEIYFSSCFLNFFDDISSITFGRVNSR